MLRLRAQPHFLTVATGETLTVRLESEAVFLLPNDRVDWYSGSTSTDNGDTHFSVVEKGGLEHRFTFDEPGSYGIVAWLVLPETDSRRKQLPDCQDREAFHLQNVAPTASFMWDPVNKERTHARNPLSAIAGLWRYIQILNAYSVDLAADLTQPGRAKFDRHEKVLRRYRDYLSELQSLLSNTTGWVRIPMTTTLDGAQSRPVELNVFIAHPENDILNYRLVDWTDPGNPELCGEYSGTGPDAKTAVNQAISKWRGDKKKKYPKAYISYEIPRNVVGLSAVRDGFSSDGGLMKWPEVLKQISNATAIASLVLTFVPIPVVPQGLAGALFAVSAFTGAVSTGLNALDRREQGLKDVKADAIDALTAASYILGIGATAVRWLRGAEVAFIAENGAVGRAVLFADFGVSSLHGVAMEVAKVGEIEAIVNDSSLIPDEKYERVVRVLGEMLVHGALSYINVRATVRDLQNLQVPKQPPPTPKGPTPSGEVLNGSPAENLKALKDPKKKIDLTQRPSITGRIRAGQHVTILQGNPRRVRQVDAQTEDAIGKSGMVREHALDASLLAQERGEYIGFQATNRSATAKIPDSATKGVHIKGKSAEGGPADGYIPVDQSLSKKVRDPSDALIKQYGSKEEVLKHFNDEVKKCIADGHAIEVKVRNAQPPPEFVTVLGDPKTGKPLVADYDMLAVGRKGATGPVREDKDMGVVSDKDVELIRDFNARLGRADNPVVHHGPANQAPKDPGINYPVTYFEPEGNIVSIARGPEGDPHRLLKEYFSMVNGKGYRMEPHPEWKWAKGGDGKWR